MATLTKSYPQSQSVSHSGAGFSYNALIEKLKFNHFALISMAILIGSCAGGIAAMYVFMSGAPLWVFIVGLGVSMANLIACIAQAPTKWVFNLFVLSIVVNTLLVITHL